MEVLTITRENKAFVIICALTKVIFKCRAFARTT